MVNFIDNTKKEIENFFTESIQFIQKCHKPNKKGYLTRVY